MIGKTLRHYRITGKLGAGGMGVVYRAEDTKLGRQVAIKVLPDLFAEHPERLARFEREARLLASLNHPNIAAIHGLEEVDGKRFLVLELVEGPTLAERIHRGPLPPDEALEICRQIAEGLEAAHEKGILHRDLKPANVKVTPEGKVKILDFGLAKAFYEQATSDDLSSSPTITAEMTAPGVILGTPAYLSPEQARGKAADRRADIWAFGCILYECLTGQIPFKGESVTEIMVKILEGTPDWERLPATTPEKAKDLLRRCLQKDCRERLHDIADARIVITEAFKPPTAEEAIPIRRPVRGWILGTAIGGLILGGTGAALVAWQLRPAPSRPVVRFSLKVDHGFSLAGGRAEFTLGRPTRTAMAIANDGAFIVYSAIQEGLGSGVKPAIYLLRMDQMAATAVAGTEGGIAPFLSPDNLWIGFWAGGKLKKVSTSGGVPVILCDAPYPFGSDWGSDDTIVFSSGEDTGLQRVSAQGGKPEILTVPVEAKEVGHRLPHFLPGNSGVLFTIMGLEDVVRHQLALLDLNTRKWRPILDDAADGRWIPTGHLVFLRQGTLMAAAFDLGRLEVEGQPVPVVENVMQALNISSSGFATAAGQYSVSNSGWLAYSLGGISPDLAISLVHVDQNGSCQSITDFKAPFSAPRFSPDGRQVTYQTLGTERQAWTYDLSRGTASRLTVEGRVAYPAWTPDGKRLVYGWRQSDKPNLYWQPADGSAPREQLTTRDYLQYPGSFAPDGSLLAFVEANPETGYDILLLDMKSRRVTPFLNSRADEGWPEVSPDGRWLAYGSDESGRVEVWVRAFPGPGGRWQISKDGGNQPIWSKDGRQLFYSWGTLQQHQVWAVDVQIGEGFSASKPRLLFKQPGFVITIPVRNWDVWPNGQGFLMVKWEESKPQPVTEMILVQNWFEEVKRLCPTDK